MELEEPYKAIKSNLTCSVQVYKSKFSRYEKVKSSKYDFRNRLAHTGKGKHNRAIVQ